MSFGHATWLAGSQFLDQGSNLCPLQWKQSPNHWTAREFPRVPNERVHMNDTYASHH